MSHGMHALRSLGRYAPPMIQDGRHQEVSRLVHWEMWNIYSNLMKPLYDNKGKTYCFTDVCCDTTATPTPTLTVIDTVFKSHTPEPTTITMRK